MLAAIFCHLLLEIFLSNFNERGLENLAYNTISQGWHAPPKSMRDGYVYVFFFFRNAAMNVSRG